VARAQAGKQQEHAPRRKAIRPKTPNQKLYWDAIPLNDMTFGIGPAGTGKSFLAVARGVEELQSGRAQRLILTRPAVEAGEKLGFLPGTLEEKMDPYMKPLIEAIKDIAGREQYVEWMALEQIEIAPLAMMRGRTLNDAFIIADEMQNATVEQIRMMLTRFGYGSKMVINGDPEQSDLLPFDSENGLDYILDAYTVAGGIEGVSMVEFDLNDIVRHPIVGRILGAFNKLELSRP